MAERAAQKPAPPRHTVRAPSHGDGAGQYRFLGGSAHDDFNQVVASQALNSLWLATSDEAAREQQIQAALSALIGIRPRDELEGMLAAQLVAVHSAAMECFRRAMIGGQTFEGRQAALGQGNKLSRTYAALLEALDKHRGKGQQVVRVEHVHVHSGGQAIVGSVAHPGGGGVGGSEEQPHAKRLAHAPEPEMRGANPEREAVPVAGGGG